MGKMDFSNFKDDTEVINVTDVTVLEDRPPKSTVSTVATGRSRSLTTSMMSGLSPVAIIETLCSTLSDISSCLASVSIEKQRTKQVQAQAGACIEESVQQTRRVEIQEKENTKRIIVECEARLKEKEIELKKLTERYQSIEVRRNQSHVEFLGQLDGIREIIESINRTKEELYQKLSDIIDNQDQLESLLRKLSDADIQLVALSRSIVDLRKG